METHIHKDVRGKDIFLNSKVVWANHKSSEIRFTEGVVESATSTVIYARRLSDGKISALTKLNNIVVVQ